MELNNKVFLLWRHAPMLEARVEVVDPPEAAAFACPVKAYMAIDKVMYEDSWLETMIFACCLHLCAKDCKNGYLICRSPTPQT
jgi:hypothetical protein